MCAYAGDSHHSNPRSHPLRATSPPAPPRTPPLEPSYTFLSIENVSLRGLHANQVAYENLAFNVRGVSGAGGQSQWGFGGDFGGAGGGFLGSSDSSGKANNRPLQRKPPPEPLNHHQNLTETSPPSTNPPYVGSRAQENQVPPRNQFLSLLFNHKLLRDAKLEWCISPMGPSSP